MFGLRERSNFADDIQQSLLTIFSYLISLYLLSFLAFAVLRVFTGISIKRLGYLSLRHISLSPKPGIHISIGKIGLSLRRSTVARPGWVSLNISGFDVTFDSTVVLHPDYDLFGQHSGNANDGRGYKDNRDSPLSPSVSPSPNNTDNECRDNNDEHLASIVPPKTFLFYVVRFFIKYANFYDFYAISSSITYTDIGSLIIGNMAFRLDWRDVVGAAKSNFVGTLDSYQLKPSEIPAHGRLTVTDLYIAEEQEDQAPREILDSLVFDVEGILGKEDLFLKELSFGLKFGKGVIYTDRLIEILAALRKFRQQDENEQQRDFNINLESMSPNKKSDSVNNAPDGDSSNSSSTSSHYRRPSTISHGILSENDVRNLTQVGTFLIRVVKEVSFKCQSISVYGLPFVVADKKTEKSNQLSVAAISKDVTLDLRRLNPNNPGSKLFFSDSQYAHQALLTIGSTAVGLDNGTSQEEIIYIPIITMMCRTNIFSQTLQLVKVQEITSDRSESIVRANVHVTTPTLNLEAHHVPVLMQAIQFGEEGSESMTPNPAKFSFSISSFQRLWPNATIRLTVEEPAARVLIPLNDDQSCEESSMVIYSSSKVYLDFETCHSLTHGHQQDYTVNGSLEISSYETWYRSPSGVRYDIFSSENLLLKATGSTFPLPTVQLSGKISNAHMLLTNYEIFNGIREVFMRMRKSYTKSTSLPSLHSESQDFESQKSSVYKPSFLRRLPPWMTRIKLEIADTAVSIASERLRKEDDVLRGLTLRVSNSLVEYRSEFNRKGTSRKHSDTQTTDRRKLAIMMEGIEGYKIIEPYGLQQRAENRFLDAPSISIAFSTQSSDIGPILQCNMLLKQVVLIYDVNLHFLGLTTIGLIQHTLALDSGVHLSSKSPRKVHSDFITFQAKSEICRIKIDLPNDAKLMLETNLLEVWRKSDRNPCLHAKAIRLYSRHPHVKNSWCILVSLKQFGVEYKENPRQQDEDQALIKSDAIRLNVPNQFIMHRIFDNVVTCAKTLINLHQQHRTKDFRLVIKPHEQKKPIQLPRIRVKTPTFLLSLEADHFESELALIFKLGVREQFDRLERERFFEEKVAIINQVKNESKNNVSGNNNDNNTNNNNASSANLSTNRTRHFTNSNMGSSSSVFNTFPPLKSHNDNSSTASVMNMPTEREGSINSLKQSKHHTFLGGHHFKLPHRNAKHDDSSTTTGIGYLSVDHENISIEQAREKLLSFNSTNWIKKFRNAKDAQVKAVKKNIEYVWGSDEFVNDTIDRERIVGYSEDPLLFYTLFRDLDLKLQTSPFTPQQLQQYLHDIGKGIPMNTRYSLLIPLLIDLKLSELRIQLSDFPLPMLHFPDLLPSQNPAIPSVTMKGNFIVAEILRDSESNIRSVLVPLVPAAMHNPNDPKLRNHLVKVCRTVESVKMYTDLHFDINSASPTRISWANSTQPALLTAMIAFDSFSKPPIDPSPNIGFWDKIRNVLHSRMTFKFNEGDVYFLIKGSRNPYELLEEKSGFAYVWKGKTVLKINESDNPKEFFVVTSEQFAWGVPNLVGAEREYMKRSMSLENTVSCRTNFKEMVNLQKVILKLSGAVKWKVGLAFEKDNEHTFGRTSDFTPHYKVQLNHPDSVRDFETYDAYKGFRSRYIHLAIGITNPDGKDWSCGKTSSDTDCYNSAHLSPKAFRYFTLWWDLFDSTLSLPVRNGTLFQDKRLSKPKFGRHLYTVQYQLALSPIFISHVYRHPHSEELVKHNKEASTGLKARIDNFVMDLHQRREPPRLEQNRWKMKLHLAELDFKSLDLRVLQAEFKERATEEYLARKLGISSSPVSSISNEKSLDSSGPSRPSTGKFKVTDNDYTWIDLDDFVELEESWHVTSTPKIIILPLLFSPQFTYFRQTDKDGVAVGKDRNGNKYVKFGDVVAHDCLIGDQRPELVQEELLRTRIDEIDEQLKTDDATLESLQKDLEEYPNEEAVAMRVHKLKKEVDDLNIRKYILINVLKQNDALPPDLSSVMFENDTKQAHITEDEVSSIQTGISEFSFDGLDDLVDAMSTNIFSNRFIFHNLQLKWNNAVRNAVFRYIHWVETRRQTMYYMTRRAIKYVEDLIESVDYHNQERNGDPSSPKNSPEKAHDSAFNFTTKACRDQSSSEGENSEERFEKFEEDLFRIFEEGNGSPCASYLFKLISPQIQLISDKNPESCLLVTSKCIELKTVDVIDETNDDEESALIERRFGVELEDAQFYVFKKENITNSSFSFFSNNYGNGKMGAWPPWLNIECCYSSSTFENDLVVDRTSVVCRYDRPNKLHVTHSDSDKESDNEFSSSLVRCEKYRPNRISVDFPKVVATCDSEQYLSVYTIVVDLLIYSEPTKKQTSECLDRVLLTTNFQDLDKAVNRLTKLQGEIRSLAELRSQFDIYQDMFDEQALHDLVRIDVETKQVALELQVMMAAIRSVLNKGQDEKRSYLKWAIAADQIIWHVLSDERTPFLDIGLADASFNRLEGSDGFNANSVEVGMMQGFNLAKNTLYPELFSPLNDTPVEDGKVKEKFISIFWKMLGPIGGIPIMERFEVKLLPLKLQMENATGRKIFEYVFPASKTQESLPSSKLNSNLNIETSEDSDSSDNEFDLNVIRKPEPDELSFVSNSTKPSTVSSSTSRLRRIGSAAGSGLLRTESYTDTESSANSSRRGSRNLTKKKPKRLSNKELEAGRDDVAIMMKRASNFMSIVELKIHPTVVLLSYKGSGHRNLTDIHEFKLNMPTIDYKNKTWSNLDMALHLKKDVIRILLQHTGSLIQNKLIKHRKKRFNQPLRQITNYASFTAIQDLAEAEVASSSTYNSGANIPRIQISGDDSPTGPVKPSLQSRNSTLSLDKKSFRFNLSPSVSRAESVKTLGSSNYNDDKIKSEDSLDGSGSISSSSNSPLKKLKNLSTTTSNSGSNKNDEDSHKKSGFLHKLLN